MPEPTYRHVQVSIQDDVLVFTITQTHVEGEEVAEELRANFLDALEKSGKRKVVIDFQHTQFLSSVAFRPLLSLRRKLQESGGGRIVVCGLSPVVGDVFYTTRMVTRDGSVGPLFEMEADVPAAVARLGRPEETAGKNP